MRRTTSSRPARTTPDAPTGRASIPRCRSTRGPLRRPGIGRPSPGCGAPTTGGTAGPAAGRLSNPAPSTSTRSSGRPAARSLRRSSPSTTAGCRNVPRSRFPELYRLIGRARTECAPLFIVVPLADIRSGQMKPTTAKKVVALSARELSASRPKYAPDRLRDPRGAAPVSTAGFSGSATTALCLPTTPSWAGTTVGPRSIVWAIATRWGWRRIPKPANGGASKPVPSAVTNSTSSCRAATTAGTT